MAMIRCEKCGKLLSTQGLVIGMEHDGDLDIQYFRCHFCGEKYIVSVTDPALREKIKKMNRMQDAVKLMKLNRKSVRLKSIEKTIEQIQRLKKEIHKEGHRLKTEYLGGKADVCGGHEEDHPVGGDAGDHGQR